MHACRCSATYTHTRSRHAQVHACTHTFAAWRNAVLLILSVVAQLFSLVPSHSLCSTHYSIAPFHLISSACLLRGQLSSSPSFVFFFFCLPLNPFLTFLMNLSSVLTASFSLFYLREVNVLSSHSFTLIFLFHALIICVPAGQVFSLDWQWFGFIGNALWCTPRTLV